VVSHCVVPLVEGTLGDIDSIGRLDGVGCDDGGGWLYDGTGRVLNGVGNGCEEDGALYCGAIEDGSAIPQSP
jgi:hypothetical protein